MTSTLFHRYADLGRQFALPTMPAKVKNPAVLLWNQPLAASLGLDLTTEQQAQFFSGQQLFPGSKPVAMAYAGHQFGHFNPQLGDGRAHLLGEIQNAQGQIHELHLKGSGRTPFSRNGDGKCAIKPAVREYLMSEALHALGVPTTRTLAVISTNEALFRQESTMGAIVTRVATSHLRVGTFEYFAARGMHEEVNQLTDLCIDRHYPDIDKNQPTKYIQLLKQAIDKQVDLLIHWLRVGFIHGVMNTDNTLLSGETIDYGPCAMLGVYDPAAVYSSIDDYGRYAFANQPNIAHWNLARFAECLIPLIDQDQDKAVELVKPVLNEFSTQFKTAYQQMMAHKLGFEQASTETTQLAEELLKLMQQTQLDYTQTFQSLTEAFIHSAFPAKEHLKLNDWYHHWQSLLNQQAQSKKKAQQLMRANNPVLIPRNHHVEAVLSEVEQTSNTESLEKFLSALSSPYLQTDYTTMFQDAKPQYDEAYRTFCGT